MSVLVSPISVSVSLFFIKDYRWCPSVWMTIRVSVGDGIDVLVVHLIFRWPQLFFQQNLCCRLSESRVVACQSRVDVVVVGSCLLLSLSLVSVRVSVGVGLVNENR